MLKKEKVDEKLNIPKINEGVRLLDNILKIAYAFIILASVFFIIKLCKELKVIDILVSLLKILAPLFLGLFFAWLFAPLVKKLQQKGVRRGLGTLVIYVLFISLLILIIGSILPVLKSQINDFIAMIPQLFDSIEQFLDNIFANFDASYDVTAIKENIVTKISDYAASISTGIPSMTVELVKNSIGTIGTFIVGLIIGFYLSISFDNMGEALITLFPTKYQKDAKELFDRMNTSLRRFINGALIDAFFVFVITSIAFSLVGLKAPLLFGLFCGITNVIPYAGPYIGGIPAVIVGFSQGPLMGIMTLVSIVVIQFLEGNFLQPVIMSKSTKLHPVTIIVGLLIFGHFFGVIGMLISTPIIAVVKSIFMFFRDKYDWKILENI